MLITGIQSDYGLWGELVVLNREILEHFGDISEDLGGFPNSWVKRMFP